MATIDITPALRIQGWMRPVELQWLAEHAQQASVVVEVGSFNGRSTRALADHCRGIVYAVDAWAGWAAKGKPRFEANLADLLAAGRVRMMQGIACAQAPVVHALVGQTVDLLFIDGDHSWKGLHQIAAAYQPMVRSGGIVAGHDYRHPKYPGLTAAVDALFPKRQLCSSIWWVRV